MKICAVCGKEIEVGESYLKVCDNFLQRKYFEAEDESDNVFCSDECLRDALSVIEFDVLEDDMENHSQEKDIGTKYRESAESEEKDRRLLSDADRVCDYSCMGRHHCEGHRMCDICRTPKCGCDVRYSKEKKMFLCKSCEEECPKVLKDVTSETL